jgi:hypothetical protein
MAKIKKKILIADKDAEQQDSQPLLGEMQVVQILWKTGNFLQSLKTVLWYNPTLPSILPSALKTHVSIFFIL